MTESFSWSSAGSSVPEIAETEVYWAPRPT